MRLALVSHHRIVPGEGVSEKLLRTARCWSSLGHHVDLLELPTGTLISPVDSFTPSPPERAPRHRLGWIARHQRWFRRAAELLDARRPDAMFIRQGLWCPAFERLVESVPTIFEINSDPIRELQHRSRLAAAYWRRTWPRLERRAAGFTAVTSELVPQSRSTDSLVLANSIEVPDAAPPRASAAEGPIVAMPIGSPSPWHGIDLAIEIARRMPEARFLLIGAPPSPAPTNVEFLPRVSESELRAILARCHAGIASLAIERAGLREACPLKSRTMLAAGLPIVYGYVDPDLPSSSTFAIRLDIARDGLEESARSVRALVQQAFTQPQLGLDAWRFALANLDLRPKEIRRLEFIANRTGVAAVPS
ncbi:MAG: hypothetical protein RJA16_510 [Planctomycetota bacterium]